MNILLRVLDNRVNILVYATSDLLLIEEINGRQIKESKAYRFYDRLSDSDKERIDSVFYEKHQKGERNDF